MGVYVVGQHAYVANRLSGLEVLNVHDPRNPVSVANLRTGGDAMGVLVKGGFAYLTDGVHVPGAKPYSYMPGADKSLKVINIKSPEHPQVLAAPRQDASEGAGLAEVVALDRIVYENIAEYAAIPGLHRINGIVAGMAGFYISSKRAYSTAGRSGLRIYDLGDANQPIEISCFRTAYSTWDVRVAGRYAYLMDSGTSIHVLDVSNPAKPQEVGQFSCTGYISGWIALQPAAPSGESAPELKPIDTAPPQLVNPFRLADGSFTFTLVGVANGSYVIQYTTDWSEWTSLSTNLLPASGYATIADPHATRASQRYYRAVRQ
jgi:hypothetical protein